MMSHQQDITRNNRQNSRRSVNHLDWFGFAGKAIFVFAFITAVIAFFLLVGWLIVSSYSPASDYKNSISLTSFDSAQSLQVEYPKLILASDEWTTVSFTLSGKSDKKTSIKIVVPPGMRVMGFRLDSAESVKTIDFNPMKAGDPPQTRTLQLFHSKTVSGWGYFSYQVIKIQVLTGNVSLSSKQVLVKTETVWWAGARNFINNSVEDKSPLILLVTGFISGAGTLIFQYLNDQRERKKNDEEKEVSALEKYKGELRLGIQNHPIIVIRNNIDLLYRTDSSDDSKKIYLSQQSIIFKEVAKENDCEKMVAEEVIKELRNEHYPKTKKLLADLQVLSEQMQSGNNYWESLSRLIDLSESNNKKTLTTEDARHLLYVCENWNDLSRPILIKLIRIYAKYKVEPSNLPVLFSVFGLNSGFGQPLLQDAKIDDSIELYFADTSLPDKVVTAARELRGILQKKINWRPLLLGQRMEGSIKLKKWLTYWGHNNKFIPFGSEYGELEIDVEKYKVEHTILERIGNPDPVLVFGNEGTGKTTTALLVMLNCQKTERDLREKGAFPVYAKYSRTPDFNNWLISNMSRAIVDFISENPRSFLNAGTFSQLAMSRLMLRHTRGVDRLRVSLQRFGVISSDECEQIIGMGQSMNFLPINQKMDDSEVLELLYMALPDGFDRAYFLVDIPGTLPLSDFQVAPNYFKEMVLSLAGIGFYVKVFAPLELEPVLGNISMFTREELVWTDDLLREIIDRRFKELKGCCDTRTGLDPYALMIKESQGSPRNLIKYGNSLIDYIDRHLIDTRRLTEQSFEDAKNMMLEIKK